MDDDKIRLTALSSDQYHKICKNYENAEEITATERRNRIAKIINYSSEALRNWERGLSAVPDISIVETIAAVYGVETEDFIDISDEERIVLIFRNAWQLRAFHNVDAFLDNSNSDYFIFCEYQGKTYSFARGYNGYLELDLYSMKKSLLKRNEIIVVLIKIINFFGAKIRGCDRITKTRLYYLADNYKKNTSFQVRPTALIDEDSYQILYAVAEGSTLKAILKKNFLFLSRHLSDVDLFCMFEGKGKTISIILMVEDLRLNKIYFSTILYKNKILVRLPFTKKKNFRLIEKVEVAELEMKKRSRYFNRFF